MSEWKDFFVTFGGAAAALTGLVLVAVSLHVRAVLAHPLYRDRAFASLVALLCALFLALAGLTPQTPSAFGAEVALVGLFWVVRSVRFVGLYRGAQARHRRAVRQREWIGWGAWIIGLLVSGIGLMAGDTRAPYVLAVSMAWAVAIIVWNVWVLLAEVSAD